ncbi:MAG: 2-hydroxychromene-2-carboxylate isomerase [Myxococcota bacterium]
MEFFFDVVSPYSYLASTQIASLESLTTVRWRPMYLGGLMGAVGNVPPGSLAPRARYMLQDLQRWAARYDVPFRFPKVFPQKTLRAMRMIEAANDRASAARRLFRAYWVEGENLSDDATLERLSEEIGEPLFERSADSAVKDALRASTDEAASRGAFGAPTFFVGDTMFFGNDRLDFVRTAISEGPSDG